MPHQVKIKHTAIGTVYTRGDPNKKRYAEVLEFPTLRSFLWARLYHYYDMRIPNKVPGWKRVQSFLRAQGAEHRHDFAGDPPARWRDRLYGWSVEQDIRCFELNHEVPEQVEFFVEK